MSEEENIDHVEFFDCLFKWRRTISNPINALNWDAQDEKVFRGFIKIVMHNLATQTQTPGRKKE